MCFSGPRQVLTKCTHSVNAILTFLKAVTKFSTGCRENLPSLLVAPVCVHSVLLTHKEIQEQSQLYKLIAGVA